MTDVYPNHIVLLALRTTAGDTQRQCADRLWVTPWTISRWEQGAVPYRKMKAIYAAYKVTPQAAQQRTAEYLDDIRHEGRPHPEDRDARPSQASRNPHAPDFLNYLAANDTIIGFDPEGRAMTLHEVVDVFCRDNNPVPGYICDALIRYLDSKRPKSGESADLI